uniref:Thioredoxin domain-containing protein n=1 Tax=Mucochytrium quahogii TaxID=96639 RepID=A0A7S2WHH3_9STRA
MYKALVAAALCAFVAHAKLEQFTQDSFDKLVKESTWVIDFASSSPSKARKTELETVADALQGTGIRVGYVDLSKEKTCGNGKPGLKVYGPDKSAKPVAIAGRFDIGNVLTKVFGEIERVVNARVGKSSKKEEKKSSKKSKKPKGGKPIDLTDRTFDEHMKTDDAVMVAFVAPWCGHCKALIPEWEVAAKQLDGSGIQIATVDATANEGLSRRFGVEGFPTIKFFPPGAMNHKDSDAEDYRMGRTADDIVKWSQEEFEKRGGRVTIEIPEISNQDALDELCDEDKKCVLVFLPHLMESGKNGRDAYIETIEGAQRQARHINFGWVEAGAQPKWEAAYSLGFGFPAVLYLRQHGEKRLGLIMRGSGGFQAATLGTFASSAKKLGEFSDAGWPAIDTVTPWNGEEAPVVEEEDDFDLDEFLNSD